MTPAEAREAELLADAEDRVAQFERDARRFARSLVARAFELAEDILAEASLVREERAAGSR
jgi:DNA-directed RNA polymerase specialized sigma24 family protein